MLLWRHCLDGNSRIGFSDFSIKGMLMQEKYTMTPLNRRDLLRLGASTGAAALLPILSIGAANADPASTAAAIKKLAGDNKLKAGRVTLEMHLIAEDGNTVPLSVEVESPMSEADHVWAIHLFGEANPTPNVASFYLSPRSGRARVSTRMRLIKTQNVIAVAQMSDGSTYFAQTEVKVTIGGCGGS